MISLKDDFTIIACQIIEPILHNKLPIDFTDGWILLDWQMTGPF